MIPGQSVLRLLLVFLFSAQVIYAVAQPTLPDLAGAADKGVVVLSWVCQYDGIKSIAVMRSADSTKINQNVGYVKELGKGLQAFADGHPEAGKNFYKLVIVFKSGLSWSSNRLGVYVDKAMLQDSKTALPANDSIQHFVVSEEMAGKSSGKQADNDTGRRHKILISFEVDSNTVSTQTYRTTAIPPQKRITVSFDDPSYNEATFIQYKYISIDPATGHVHMILSDDVGLHHYSIKFYDGQNHVVIEVPKISRPNIIFDRRNFQKKGIYKFVIRRDVVELESGYVEIKAPNP